ncbi:hypothetical protein IFT75_02810 [Pseudomonas sp. CFBP 8758]|uniref:hypothetical protein n=1 Tax=Pseudomonas sp. CFBP 8758 TaxID=2775286 RepID=UPI00177D3DE3|nr:hypothetical protein [Pseudomonas sp. CFBP 8758]MBD8592331.1 hypothetical protein [Pseudomonas sp. CFBP 8758]
MGKPSKISYDEAIAGLTAEKHWEGAGSIEWVMTTAKQWPASFKFRTALRVGSVRPEGLFLQLDYKMSLIEDVPDKLYMTLLVNNSRVFGVDVNGFAGHINKVGVGKPFFMRRVSHPHIHLPVPEASYGYIEPIDEQPVSSLWQLFLSRANILGAPPLLNHPKVEQNPQQMRLI